MKKKILMLLSFVLALCIVYATPIGQAYAEENILNEETKSYCTATLDYEFADNRVLVVLSQSATMSFKTYTPMDFPEVNCSKVIDSNEYTGELVQQQIKTKKNKSLNLQDSTENFINTDDFRTVLILELTENSKENVLETIKRLEQRDDIISVEPDYSMTYFAAPNPIPTYYLNQWALSKIEVPLAWDLTTGSSSVVVGVMDSGIDGNHLDLKDRIATNMCGNFTTGSVAVTNPTDPNGHGTMVAGIIGAQRNSGTPGITGIAQNIRLASLQVNNPDEGGNGSNVPDYVSSVLRAIEFAKQKEIPIINLSSGYDAPKGTSDNNSSLETAIRNYPGLFVCAAGNGTNNNGFGKSNDNSAIYPANFRLPNLISVGSTNNDDSLSSFSNYGKTTVDIFAPGNNIYSTYRGSYTSLPGTSMAAPHVAGVAALIKSINPSFTPAQIKSAIMNNVDKASATGTSGLPSLYGKCVSNGRLNAFRAVTGGQQQYTVTLDKSSGLDGTSSVIALYGSAMPAATAPTRSSYIFGGYFSSSGVQYYDKNMVSVRYYDIPSNTTLYAVWKPEWAATHEVYVYTINGSLNVAVPFNTPVAFVLSAYTRGYYYFNATVQAGSSLIVAVLDDITVNPHILHEFTGSGTTRQGTVYLEPQHNYVFIFTNNVYQYSLNFGIALT